MSPGGTACKMTTYFPPKIRLYLSNCCVQHVGKWSRSQVRPSMQGRPRVEVIPSVETKFMIGLSPPAFTDSLATLGITS